LKKKYTERKYKKEYLKIKSQIDEIIEHSKQDDKYILPYGSKLLSNILNFTLQNIDEDYRSYELKLHQLICLLHLLESECNDGSLNASFRGELYNISFDILKLNEEWKNYSLLIKDKFPQFK
jgi:hypothetical protein